MTNVAECQSKAAEFESRAAIATDPEHSFPSIWVDLISVWFGSSGRSG